MGELAQQRCFNHLEREAVARCPECARFYCRECITEHDDRVICAACLRRLGARAARRHSFFRQALLLSRATLGFLFLWVLLYYLGQMLLTIPSAFHEGTLWSTRPWENL